MARLTPRRVGKNPFSTPFLTDAEIEAQARRLARIAAGERGAISAPYERQIVGLETLGREYGTALEKGAAAAGQNLAVLQQAAGGYGGGVTAGAAAAQTQAGAAAPAAARSFVRSKQADALSKQAAAEQKYETDLGVLTSSFMDTLQKREVEKAASIAELEATAKALDFKYDSLESEETRFFSKLKQDGTLAREKMANALAIAKAKGAGGLTKNKVFKDVASFVNERIDNASDTKIPTGFTGSVVFKFKPTPEQVASGDVAVDASGFAVSDPVSFDWKNTADLNAKIAAQYPSYKPSSVMIQTQDTREESSKVYTYSLPALRKQAMSIAMSSGMSRREALAIVNQIFAGVTR
jgi:hypothetical protein